jgi:ABC-type multidrug transport system fused ATPase/permease subunit
VHADQIIVLSDGEIVERGRHEELVANGKLYFELYQRQSLGFTE